MSSAVNGGNCHQSDYRFVMVLHWGLVTAIGAGIAYTRLFLGAGTGHWIRDFGILGIVALVLQFSTSLALASDLFGRRRLYALAMAFLSLAAIAAVVVVIRCSQ